MATTGDVLRRKARALVFDLYGTVVDRQSALTAAINPFPYRQIGQSPNQPT